MSVINKGEKHLFKFRVLQADDTVIPYQDIVSLSLDLTVSGEKVANTFSKTDLVESGDYLNLEYDASQNNDGTYYFRGTLVVNDDEFDSGQSNDISWITDPITVTSAFTSYNESETEYDIKFDVDALGTVTISNSTLSSTVTDFTITVSFTKATGSNSANFVYELYRGDETTLGDVSTIKNGSLEDSGTDVATLALPGSEGEFINFNILVTDPATGMKKIYDANSVLVPEQEVTDVEIYDQDPAIFTSALPIASFQNSGSLDLSSEQGIVRLYAEVSAFNGADDTVTWSTSDASKVSITVIDDYTADINYVSSEAGDVITITATSDFDSLFKASVDINLYADTSVANTESTTFELQT